MVRCILNGVGEREHLTVLGVGTGVQLGDRYRQQTRGAASHQQERIPRLADRTVMVDVGVAFFPGVHRLVNFYHRQLVEIVVSAVRTRCLARRHQSQTLPADPLKLAVLSKLFVFILRRKEIDRFRRVAEEATHELGVTVLNLPRG